MLLISPAQALPVINNARRGTRPQRSTPRNQQGEFVCAHDDCEENRPTFKRLCEWNKHMDKHERPYKCSNSACKKNPGFTYAGGLLRHQREAHHMHLTKESSYCPHSSCNRSTGTGFSRRENLEEHLRRRHLDASTADDPVAVNDVSSQIHNLYIRGLQVEDSQRLENDIVENVLIEQRPARPITEQQLKNEVKGIYAGLVMVEKKCVEIVTQQSQSTKRLSDQQWKALVALHRTLLQEHHDFFSASQNPTASETLKKLAIKYAMPARMWRHGIHVFLELLRYRLPDPMEHMLSFVYLSYSMMALLKESVPSFIETWIECLGDLARYRMAIEDTNPRDREIWSNVARTWYNEAADKSPSVGRIQHHLAVLARPNVVEQLFYYNKALVSVIPFVDAGDSIMLLFDMLLKTSDTIFSETELFTDNCDSARKAMNVFAETSDAAVKNSEDRVRSKEPLSMPQDSFDTGNPEVEVSFLQKLSQLACEPVSRFVYSLRSMNRYCLVLWTVVSLLQPAYAAPVKHVPTAKSVGEGDDSNYQFALLVCLWLLGSLVTVTIPMVAPKLPIVNPKATSSISALVAALGLTMQGVSLLSHIWYALCTGTSLGSSIWLGRLTRSRTNSIITAIFRYIIPTGAFYMLFRGAIPDDENSRLDLSAAVPCLSVFGASVLNALVNEKMEELGLFALRMWERLLRLMGLERRRVHEMA